MTPCSDFCSGGNQHSDRLQTLGHISRRELRRAAKMAKLAGFASASMFGHYAPTHTVLSSVAARCQKYVGAHVSVQGGIENAVLNAYAASCQCFALFLKSQRKWDTPILEAKHTELFKTARNRVPSFRDTLIMPHGSYLVNLGDADEQKWSRSFEVFLDDVKRCEQLGIALYNFHPGSSLSGDRAQSLARISHAINLAHQHTTKVCLVLENTAGAGNTLGGSFEELATLIAGVRDKERVGVCLDTCHAFAYGYDISTAESFDQVLQHFDRVVGLRYLKAMHINDSKADRSSKRDRHENIGKGKLGLAPFRFIMNDARFARIPLILETPVPADASDPLAVYRAEIRLLYSLVEDEQVQQQLRQLPPLPEIVLPATVKVEAQASATSQEGVVSMDTDDMPILAVTKRQQSASRVKIKVEKAPLEASSPQDDPVSQDTTEPTPLKRRRSSRKAPS